ncbi:MAG: RHS repeat-associated core domain-containing protein [Sedimenticola sp.]
MAASGSFDARYYDPDVARFITQDSYLGEGGTPPSLHRYLYAYANPLAYIDPTGHAPITDELGQALTDQAENHLAQINEDSSLLDVGFHGFVAGASYVTGGAVEVGNFTANIITSTSIFGDETRDRANRELGEAFTTFDKLNENKAAVASGIVKSVRTNIGGAVAGSRKAQANVLAGVLSLAGGGQGLAGKGGVVTNTAKSAVNQVAKQVPRLTGEAAKILKGVGQKILDTGKSVAQRVKANAKQAGRNRAAKSIKTFQNDMKELGYKAGEINSYVKAFETQSFRYGANLNPFKRFYRHYNAGERMGGPWVHDTKTLLKASPFKRKIDLALPESSKATASAWTRIPLLRKSASGSIAHQSSLFTGLPGRIKTGGLKQWFVPSKPVAGLPHLNFRPIK